MSCPHRDPEDVRLVTTDELVAKLCTDCDEQLEPDFDPTAYPNLRLKKITS